MVFQPFELRHRVGIVPGGALLGLRFAGYLVFRDDVVVAGAALPFAVRTLAGFPQELHLDVLRRDVVDWRVARLENALCPCGVREREAAEDDLDLLIHVLEPRRTRVVPDRLLSLTWLYSPAAHEEPPDL